MDSKIDIYIEKDIFVNILIEFEKYPNWNSILYNCATVLVNMSEEDFKRCIDGEDPVFLAFFNSIGGDSDRLTALPDYFKNLNKDSSIILEKPRSVHFLNKEEQEAKELQDNYGVLVQTMETINDNLLTRTFFKDLSNTKSLEKSFDELKRIIQFDFPPSNAMVISDRYLFKNNIDNIACDNLVALFDRIIPNDICHVPYHISIFTDQDKFQKRKFEKIHKYLMKETNKLREFNELRIDLLIVNETIHKRLIILNYTAFYAEIGFDFLQLNTNRNNLRNRIYYYKRGNDIRIENVFSRNKPEEGDTVYNAIESNLKELKRLLRNHHLLISNGEKMNNRLL